MIYDRRRGLDVIHGFRAIFPVPIAMAASWDMGLIEEGQAVAAEARAIGLHWTFAPMVDIARDQRWGRMIEGAGEDPYLGSEVAAAQVRGFQGEYFGVPGHIIAGPKHFAGYGAALGGRDYDEAEISDSELWNVDLPPFKAAVGINGVPATGNRWLLRDVLKGVWGFDGFTVSDANSAFDLATHNFARDANDAGVRGISAGLDMEMSQSTDESAFRTLAESMKAGNVAMADVDDAVRRILTAKFRMGLFDNPYVNLGQMEVILGDAAHRTKSRKAAERSFALLRNEGDVLPLDPAKLNAIAVIGPLADAACDTIGPWVFAHDNAEKVTVLSGIRAKLGYDSRVDYSPGVSIIARENPSFFDALPGFDVAPLVEVDDDAEIARAVALAGAADCAVLVLVEVDLNNTGSLTVDEVAQLYIHQRCGTTARPVRELKGFERVTLEPGETRIIAFYLRAQDLRYWSAATRDWVQDETLIDIFVGGDSTASLSTSLTVSEA